MDSKRGLNNISFMSKGGQNTTKATGGAGMNNSSVFSGGRPAIKQNGSVFKRAGAGRRDRSLNLNDSRRRGQLPSIGAGSKNGI